MIFIKEKGGCGMEYSVKELAELSGVSSRTLRYYDEIGLLKPARWSEAGYRVYEEKEVDLLQQILFYRELGIELKEIKRIVCDPSYDQLEALKGHYRELEQKRNHLDQLLSTVRQTISSRERGIRMSDPDKFAGFKEQLIEENEKNYGKEAREKYGEDTIDESNDRLRDMSEEKFEKMKALEADILQLLKEAYATGNPASKKAQELADKHRQWLLYSWKSYSKEAHAGLAEMYVADERFKEYYEKVVQGGAQFLKEAILNYVATE